MSLLFPNVPIAPGVPQVVRSASNTFASIEGQVGQIANILQSAFSTPPIWGIFPSSGAQSLSGSGFNVGAILNAVPYANFVTGYLGTTGGGNGAVVTPDSIREFDQRAEWKISNYPIQQGSFASYNKVKLPEEQSVRMVRTGSLSDRQTFVKQIATIAASLDLYTIITPEATYSNCSVTRYEITRKGASDAYTVIADVFFQQILQTTAQYSTTSATPDTSNAESPSALPNTSQGTVQPTTSDQINANTLATMGIS